MYTQDIRAVYQDLVCMGVAVTNVILCSKETFARQMFSEARRLSKYHVCEKIIGTGQVISYRLQ